MIPRLKDVTYEDRLRKSNLLSSKQQRERQDMIAIYKLMTGKVANRRGWLDQAKRECLDKERWRLFCCDHSFWGTSLE